MSPKFIRRDKGSGAGSPGDGERGAKPSRPGASRYGAPRQGGAFRGPKPEWRGDGERGSEWGGAARGERGGSERPGASRRDGPRPEGSRYEPRRFEGRRSEGRPYEARGYEGRGDEDRRPQGRPGGDRFKAPRPERFGAGADRPLGRRPGGDRAYGDRPYGEKPQGRRFEAGPADERREAGAWGDGARSFGARPSGGRPLGTRPLGGRSGGGRSEGRGADGRPGGERPFGARAGRAPDRNAGRSFGRSPSRGPDRSFDARPERFDQTSPLPAASGAEGPSGSDRFGAEPADDLIWGRHPAQAALESERPIHRIWCTPELRFSPKFLQLLREAKASGVLVEEVTWARLGQVTGGAVHQGIVLQTAAAETFDLDDLIAGCRSLEEPALLMAVDGLTDPHNLGAIVRSAEALGAHGLVLPQRRTAGLTGSVAKVAAGALEHLPVARVVNLNRSLDTLKQEGYRVIGLAEEGSVSLIEADLDGPLVLVTGSEGDGLSMLTRKHCDQLVRIPLRGVTPSLNASVATALLLYELARRGWMSRITGSAPAPRLRRPQLRTSPAAHPAPPAADPTAAMLALAELPRTDPAAPGAGASDSSDSHFSAADADGPATSSAVPQPEPLATEPPSDGESTNGASGRAASGVPDPWSATLPTDPGTGPGQDIRV
ncbi:23S rRNA (guanosine(2251)-2'-O)-methyltransferase RlmB [Cyanobium sp. Morenito 9A2]|uniref:23S rRNA (guanosine(2251)-2'-O)-methyltransferase RlmB n=1 Tax=Cyanobium sp. Morenito 9A2 TaxID=2823718 RepID=UPI0020CE2D2D|nr:23S rRNA (guanosine(2251)-2'-O)-methyltransferase RlmB [Cyanobium sp. Morenito 9A2]MCP9849478.1 23S rRNA (guanosine(2251)-2'-O)-methyltransferase RlmB [Cyanobium sp. Morenito 9A2]